MTSAVARAENHRSETSPATFTWHLLVMVAVMIVAMYAGMFLVGPALSKLFGLFGHPHALDGRAVSILLMLGYMVAGLVTWLAFRGYRRRTIIEIAVSLLIPYAVLIGPFVAGRISADAFTTAMHGLMLILLIAAMLHRRDEFDVPRRASSL
jgi:hypothetical protein